ncbi:MAG TPA: hypothetical protein VFO55_09680 [Gemmatimonadaceae bacterium]|nr:hypothetical protein [Gemmatimonadaceae bacterium]
MIELAFDGDRARYDKFISLLLGVTPEDGSVILRGSAVTGYRWADNSPFDADGPGTSDLDVTFVGGGMLNRWNEFYIPALHTVPLSDEHPDACPELKPLRFALCSVAGRPVNLQATTSVVQFARDVTMDQPWVELIENREKAREEMEAARSGAPTAEPG